MRLREEPVMCFKRFYKRFVCAPVKTRFFVAPMNLIDFMTLIPFYLSILLEELEDFQIIGKAGKILRLLKVLELVRFCLEHGTYNTL